MSQEIDFHSPTWRAVKRYAEQRLVKQRRMIEAPGLPSAETENVRGAIKELNLLLALADPPKISEHTE